MKSGFTPAAGLRAEARLVVDETLLASFDGVVVHRVLGTAPLVALLELAGRRVILPWLEEHEEGVGHAIAVTHRAPALPGHEVIARATLSRVEGNRVVCAVEARSGNTLIADGEFTQVILAKTTLARRFGSG